MSYLVRELKPHFERNIQPLLTLLSKAHVDPNVITLLGLVFVIVGSFFLYMHTYFWSFVFLALGGFADAIDGALARKNGSKNEFGAFLDSLTDRFSDAFPLIAISLSSEKLFSFISLLALVFSFGVSYARARAEGLGHELKVGLFERPERWITLLLGILIGAIELALMVILLGSFITLIQRVYAFKNRTSR
ncbi:CDP-alcohol phosphatidyltransferase [Hydrogenobacter thermophilus TK-6]|uniref:CDP-alcohol phosphatidyltransferase n=1 Tax=Hydrogenobacter thermophilus (strain DSM 6534 / IAM 12695 / TK-6) TaxID=608538 RepID=D3DK08_HYDTT|nr:CDP-alcohol phosphatidyltransferase family protein [Hydrogenobacter thermophilus]ADO46081.1 CDP-alcohol phosphatidyltransferase [Hydrogenobacter thermophilus TK-6]BAI70160.1 CDP-alcohol phosphatidyltransferase [Hydrogenobacter thermophilus TK-6]